MEIDRLKNTMLLGNMPFYWRIKDDAKSLHHTLPSRMEYTFEYVPSLDLIQSLQTPELKSTLEIMYRQDSNIGFLKDGHTLASSYGGDFLDCLNRYLEKHPIKSILEIGCGGCLLLDDLQKRNYDVQGIDPSPVADRAGRKKGIKVIQDFFPSEKMQKKVDLIFHVDVFEHVPDPVNFLSQQAKLLKQNGLIIINVPDCTDTIRSGDISIAQHQHVNSFDVSSLARVIEATGLNVIDIEKSRFGGSLYGVATNGNIEKPYVKPDKKYGHLFFEISASNFKKFKKTISNSIQQKNSIGFYMPLRVIPYLSAMDMFEGFRLFDDIAHWHKGFIDGLDVPIENFDNLKANPVDDLFIMSFTFGEKLKAKINKQIPKVNVHTIEEILS